MKLNKKTLKEIALREKRRIETKSEMRNYAILSVRPDNMMPQVICPKQTRRDFRDAITKKLMPAGTHVYRCNVNPVRLNPLGPERVEVTKHLINNIHKYLPSGNYYYNVPKQDNLPKNNFLSSKNATMELRSKND